MNFDLRELVHRRMGENYELHQQHVNSTLVQVQRTIGFDKVYTRASGAYLYDEEGLDYLDFLSGYSVFNIGRNHPVVRQALEQALEMDLPNMVQMDCSLLSGLLAERLVELTPPHLDAVFFCNSGTEAVEGALKFARAATGRSEFISLESSYHGLTYGSLSITSNDYFQEGFTPMMSGCHRLPPGDLEELERLLKGETIAALIVEPVQGKTVWSPQDDFFVRAQELCRRHGTLFICDEVQTGLGRTGKWFGFQHWDLEPDIITLAKSLSGGYVPCGAIITRRAIYQNVFSRLDRCVVHSTTFGRNNLAMACGLASLAVLESEGLVENAKQTGHMLLARLEELKGKHSWIREIRGRGLILAVEFQEPKEWKFKMGWKFLHKVDKSLFPQLVVSSLLSRHRILSQVAGHNTDVLKILPPLIIGETEVSRFVHALDDVLVRCGNFPGPMWDMGKNFVRHSLQAKKQKSSPAEAALS